MNFLKILIVLVVLALIGWGIISLVQKSETIENSPEAPLVGNDRDEHGCIGSAGYAWCEAKGECLRPWEEEWDESCGTIPSEEATTTSPTTEENVSCSAEVKMCSDGSYVGRVAPICAFDECPGEEATE